MATLSKQQVKDIIQNAPQGTKPEDIITVLKEKGYDLEGMPVTQNEMLKRHQQALVSPEYQMPEQKAWGGAAKNIFPSAVNLGKGLVDPRTYIGMGKVLAGGFQSLPLVKEASLSIAKNPERVKENQQAFKDFIGYAKDRWGSLENLSNTAYNDPVGLAFDLYMVGKGVEGIAKKSGVLPKALEKNVEVKLPKAVEGVGQGISRVFQAGKEKVSNMPLELEIKNMKLTPSQKVLYGPKVQEVAQWNLKNLKPGTAIDRFNQVKSIVGDMENIYQEGLKGSGIKIKKSQIKSSWESYKQEMMRNNIDATTIEKQIDAHIKTLDKLYPGKNVDIPIESVNELKRSIYDGAYNQAGNKVLNEIELGSGGVLKDIINKAGTDAGLKINNKNIGEFNKEYGTAINSQKILKNAMAKPESGTVNKIISSGAGGLVGGVVGGPVGAITGILAGEKIGTALGGTYARSTISNVIKKGVNKLPKSK